MKVSVLTITYNQERFIAQALDSILAQEVNFDYEIVVGEDCSTDGTRAILMDFHRRYPDKLVPLLRGRNIGAMPNFEATLRECRGEYLAVLEGDDYWKSPDKLQRQVDFLDSHPDYAICCARAEIRNETDLTATDVFPACRAGTYTIEDLLRNNFVATCSVVYRRSAIGAIPSWLHKMKLGDWPLHALAATTGKIHLMDDIMAGYRMHPGGTWSLQPRSFQLAESARMLAVLDKHLGYRYRKRIQVTLLEYYFELSRIAREQGDRVATATYLLGCLRNGGWRCPGSRRTLAAYAAYALLGSWYKIFSRARRA